MESTLQVKHKDEVPAPKRSRGRCVFITPASWPDSNIGNDIVRLYTFSLPFPQDATFFLGPSSPLLAKRCSALLNRAWAFSITTAGLKLFLYYVSNDSEAELINMCKVLNV